MATPVLTPVTVDDPSAEASKLRIVLVEDDPALAQLIVDELAAADLAYTLVRVTHKAQLWTALRAEPVDVILCPYRGKGVRFWQTLEIMHTCRTSAALVVVGWGLTDSEAIECIRLGADDYVLKGDLVRLPHAISKAVEAAQANQATVAAERSYQRLFDTLPVAVFRTTLDGIILDANPAAVVMFGFHDREEMLAAQAAELYADTDDRRAMVEKLQADGYLIDFESRMLRPDGSAFWFNRAVHVVREGEDGEAIVWEVIGRDTTEQREAERRLRESQAYLSGVIETAPDAIVRMDESGAITDWNAGAVTTFGWTRAEVIGRNATATIIPPRPPEPVAASDGDSDRQGLGTLTGSLWHRYEAIRKNGEIFPIEVAMSAPITVGETSHTVAFVRDMSERKEARIDLATSEGHLRSLLAGAPVALASIDLEGRITFAGGRLFSQLGVDAPDVVGLLVTDIFASRPDALAVWTTGLEEYNQADLEFGDKTFHVRCAPYTVLPGEGPVGVRVVALDNTDRVAGDRRLARRASSQAALLELSRLGLEGGVTAEFLAKAVELVARGTGAPYCTILELQSADNTMVRTAAFGLTDLEASIPLPVDPEFLVAALSHDAPVMAIDFEAADAPARSPWMIDHGIVATVVAGIAGPFGTLSVHTGAASKFGADDIEFLQLASRVISVAVERKRADDDRRMLLARLVTAQETERQVIAADVHDDAVQVMTAANMRLEVLLSALTQPAQIDAARRLQETISLSIGRLRALIFDLVPPDLDRHGLAAALRTYLKQLEADSGVRWQLKVGLDHEPPPHVSIILFRIFQEALMNVRKHARATTATVSIRAYDGGVELEVADDGDGFQAAVAEPGHLGLASMRERAEIAGGWCRLSSRPRRGTQVTIWVPASSQQEAPTTPAAEAAARG